MAQEFQEVTRLWVEDPSSTSHGTKRSEIAKRMRAQYFDLDPYIRGRGAYHRLGNIVGKYVHTSFGRVFYSTYYLITLRVRAAALWPFTILAHMI